MSNTENPLARWSRRKREGAEASEQENASAKIAHSSATHESSASEEVKARARETAPGFGAETLPPIESITAETDIRAFLALGVPPELTRAALRRAWRADPKIRDFVGLADYDWDFNAHGATTGFGSLDLSEVRRHQVVEAIQESVESTRSSSQQIPPQPRDAQISGEADASRPRAEKADQSSNPPLRHSTEGALHHQSEGAQGSPSVAGRKHGSALPK
jgi:hypothetical protein